MHHRYSVDCMPILPHVRLGARLVGGDSVTLRILRADIVLRFHHQGIRLYLQYPLIPDHNAPTLSLQATVSTLRLERLTETSSDNQTQARYRSSINITYESGGSTLTFTRQGVDYRLPLANVITNLQPDRETLEVLRGIPVPSPAQFPDRALKLLRHLAPRGTAFQAALRLSVRDRAAWVHAQQQQAVAESLLERWRRRLAHVPGFYMDRHVCLIADPLGS